MFPFISKKEDDYKLNNQNVMLFDKIIMEIGPHFLHSLVVFHQLKYSIICQS